MHAKNTNFISNLLMENNKWQHVLRKLVTKAHALLQRSLLANDSIIASIVIYITGTKLMSLFYFGTFGEVYADGYQIAEYYVCCAMVPLLLLGHIFYIAIKQPESINHLIKIISVIYFLSILMFIAVAIDGINNVYQLAWLDNVYDGMQGEYGLFYILLCVIGVKCLMNR